MTSVAGARWSQNTKPVLDTEWMDEAACFGLGNRIDFVSESPGEIATAKRVCRECPVRARCRDYALARGEVGVWGGKSTDELQALRRSAARRDRIARKAAVGR